MFSFSAAIAGVGGALFTLTSSPFGNTSAPTEAGIFWLAVAVTFGIRRPGGALLAGLFFSLGTSLFGRFLNWNDTIHSATQSPYFLPILFGIGAIGLAREPDGLLAQSAKPAARLRAWWSTRRSLNDEGATPPTSVTGTPEATSDLASAPAAEARHPGLSTPLSDDRPVVLAFENITAGYGAVEVLRGTNFEVREGSIVALLGANGAGKTTLCRVATGLISPAIGRTTHRGRDITASPPHQRALEGILSSPEGRGVFPGLSVEENLSVWLPSDELRSRAFDHFPILGDRRRQMAGLLSGGEQQMLSLVSALVRPPDLFIADEPTLGLAPLAAEAVCETLDELRTAGVTVLLVEEKATEVLALADTVAFMTLGEITWSGPRSEVDVEQLTSAYLGAEQSTT
jgi:ABC-type branched-subunit amino acid transport system ATPase component